MIYVYSPKDGYCTRDDFIEWNSDTDGTQQSYYLQYRVKGNSEWTNVSNAVLTSQQKAPIESVFTVIGEYNFDNLEYRVVVKTMKGSGSDITTSIECSDAFNLIIRPAEVGVLKSNDSQILLFPDESVRQPKVVTEAGSAPLVQAGHSLFGSNLKTLQGSAAKQSPSFTATGVKQQGYIDHQYYTVYSYRTQYSYDQQREGSYNSYYYDKVRYNVTKSCFETWNMHNWHNPNAFIFPSEYYWSTNCWGGPSNPYSSYVYIAHRTNYYYDAGYVYYYTYYYAQGVSNPYANPSFWYVNVSVSPEFHDVYGIQKYDVIYYLAYTYLTSSVLYSYSGGASWYVPGGYIGWGGETMYITGASWSGAAYYYHYADVYQTYSQESVYTVSRANSYTYYSQETGYQDHSYSTVRNDLSYYAA